LKSITAKKLALQFGIHRCNDAGASTSGQQRCKEVSAVSMAERKGLIFPFLQSQLAALQINPPPKNHSCSRLSIKKRVSSQFFGERKTYHLVESVLF
jgi:hypothetical protein